MSRRLLLLPLFFVSTSIQAQAPIEKDRTSEMIERAHRLVAVDADGCLKSYDKNEIIVCGAFDANRKHRLPFPELAAKPGERKREPLPKGNAEIVQQGRCYVTLDERNCFKGLPLMTVSFGRGGGGLGGPAGRLWRVIEPQVPDEDYVKQVQVRANKD